MTVDEAKNLIASKGHNAFDLDEICARCGGTWGHDHLVDGSCISPFSSCGGALSTTFFPKNQISTIIYSDGPPTITSPVVEAKKEDMPDWKRWRNDQPGCCPCGISRLDCWIHKD